MLAESGRVKMQEEVYKECYGIKYYRWINIPEDRVPNIEKDRGKNVLVAGATKKEKYILKNEYNGTFTLMDQNQAYKSFIREAVALEGN
jgi:hypothetical protein